MTTQLALFAPPAPPPAKARPPRYGWTWRRDHTTWDDRLPSWVCEPSEGVVVSIECHGAVWGWAVFRAGEAITGETESMDAAEEAAREAVEG